MDDLELNAVLTDGPEPEGGRHVRAEKSMVEYRATTGDGTVHRWLRSSRLEPHELAAALPAGAPRLLLCEVADRGLQGPAVLDGGRDDECHLVLSLADALTAGWWVRRTAGGGRTTSFLADLDEGCIVACHRIV